MAIRSALTSGLVALMGLTAVAACSAATTNEMRGVWLNASQTAKAGTAEQTAERLEGHGFNAVFMRYEADSEPLRNLIAACRRHHVATHIWLFRPPIEKRDAWKCLSYDLAKDTMVPGRECLCDEEYLQACEEKVRQIAREYDVDGIHFDEVGFGFPWQSLCDRCKQRFIADTNVKVLDWPNDVMRLGQVTRTNMLNLGAWRGPYLDAFVKWRCGRVAKYLQRLCDAAKSVRPLTVSYAAMAEPSADEVFYGENLAELARIFDFIVPMSYYTQYSGMSGGRPEWTAEICQILAKWVHQGNPKCQVYAGISAYGADGGWFAPVRELYEKLVAAGTITPEQRTEHLKYRTCKQGFDSLAWLRAEGKVSQDEYEQVKAKLEARTPTSDEMVRAVRSIRKAGLSGFVFFRYECMFEDAVQGVIGQDLWPRLKETLAEPTVP